MAGRPAKQPKKVCVNCGKDQVMSSYYNSNSIMFKDGKVPLCKTCITSLVNEDDVGTLKAVLMQIDKPFVDAVWSQCSIGANPVGNYFRQINSLPQYKSMTWKDGDVRDEPKVANTQVYDFDTEFKVTPDIVRKWGKNYSVDEYERLEDFYDSMCRDYTIETAAHMDYLKKICKTSLQMDRALEVNDITSYAKLSKNYDDLMKSAKFTAVQRTAADRTGGLNTFSEFYEYMEKEGFIPKYHMDEPQDIVDNTLANIKNWTRNLVLGDPNIGKIVDETLKKMSAGEQVEEEIKEIEIEEEEGYWDIGDGLDGVPE